MLIIFSKQQIDSDELIRIGIAEYAKLFNKFVPEYKIIRNDNKKPSLMPDFLKFNLSHSGDYTVIAISEENIGIDIQKHKEIDYQAIQKRFFHKEENSQTLREFYHLWAAKEAYLKNNPDISLAEALKTLMRNKDIQILNLIDDYSIAIDCLDKDYLFMFK